VPPRPSKQFPDDAALHCRAGNMALKGNLPEKASANFLLALKLNPLLWEAFEGLCALGTSACSEPFASSEFLPGSAPDISILYPLRPPPVKRMPPEEHHPMSMAQNSGFFTPDPLFRGWKHDSSQPQPFRMVPVPRDSLFVFHCNLWIPLTFRRQSNDSYYPADNTFHQAHRSTRSQPIISGPTQLPTSRPLSSADETGPATKKLRSTARQPEGSKPSRPPKSMMDDSMRKASLSHSHIRILV
jgi:anaphase-promoting complex subunit 3